MMSAVAAKPGDAGFTLLETLIAFTILAGALTMMLQGLSIAARHVRAADAAETLQEFAGRADSAAMAGTALDRAEAIRATVKSEDRVITVGGIYAGTMTLRRIEVGELSSASPDASELVIASMAIRKN